MSFCDKSRADRVKTKITFPTLSVCSLALWLAVEPDGATLLTMLAALLHEAGHLLTARLLGVGVSEITLLPLGADIKFSRLTTYREDILTGISGAAANILSALLLLPLGAHPAVRYFICSNLALAAINLLPVDTLDGGTVLRGILSARMPEKTASAVMTALSAASLSVLWLCSVYLMLRSCTGIELWAICMSVMLGMLRRNR